MTNQTSYVFSDEEKRVIYKALALLYMKQPDPVIFDILREFGVPDPEVIFALSQMESSLLK